MTNKEKCVEMWEDIVECGGDKDAYFERNAITDVPPYSCYACEEALIIHGERLNRCIRCPIYAGKGKFCYDDKQKRMQKRS